MSLLIRSNNKFIIGLNGESFCIYSKKEGFNAVVTRDKKISGAKKLFWVIFGLIRNCICVRKERTRIFEIIFQNALRSKLLDHLLSRANFLRALFPGSCCSVLASLSPWWELNKCAPINTAASFKFHSTARLGERGTSDNKAANMNKQFIRLYQISGIPKT